MMTTKTINAYAANEAGGVLEPFTYEVGELGANEVEIDVPYCGLQSGEARYRIVLTNE